jgi:hypothetical protein
MLYIGVFRQDHSRQGLQHFPSLYRTLSREDLDEIGKGINTVSNKRLNGYHNGFGRVNLLLGRIRRYQVRFGSATRCAPVSPLGRARAR